MLYDSVGNLRWSAPLLFGFNEYAQRFPFYSVFDDPPYPSGAGDIAQGSNGKIYLLDSQDTGYSTGWQTHLRGFDAETGTSVMDTDLINGMQPDNAVTTSGDLVVTTSSGILVGNDRGARLYSYDGQLRWTRQYWNDGSVPDLGIRDRAPDGGLLAAGKYDLGGTCNDLRGTLRVYGTADGGAILADFQPGHKQPGSVITSISPTGSIRWTRTVTTGALEGIRVSADNTVAIIDQEPRPCGSGFTCGSLVVRFVSALTGDLTGTLPVTINTPDPVAFATFLDSNLPALVNAEFDDGRLILAYLTTTDPSDSGKDFFRVEAIPVTGVGEDVAFQGP